MEELFTVRRGNFPLILVALHGGSYCPDGLRERTTGTILADKDTIPLLNQFDRTFQKKYPGHLPSLVIVRLHRKYCDLNRSFEDCYDRPGGESVKVLDKLWHDVHGWISEEVDRWTEILGRQWPLLLDIHGYAAKSSSSPVYRGTYHGQTFRAEGNLSKVWKTPMSPGTWSERRENSRYRGGFLVQRFQYLPGQAIQWEFPDWMRTNREKREKWCISLWESLDEWDEWMMMIGSLENYNFRRQQQEQVNFLQGFDRLFIPFLLWVLISFLIKTDF